MSRLEAICADLCEVQGALGVALYSNGRAIASRFPPVFAEERVNLACQGLSRVAKLAARAGYAEPELVLHFERGVLFSRRVEESISLALLCGPDAPRGIVELSLGVAVDDLQAALSAEGVAVAGPSPAVGVEATSPAPLAPAGLSEELERSCRELRAELTHEVGPIAPLIMRHALERWRATGPPTLERLDDLKQHLLDQVEDEPACRRLSASDAWRG